MDNEFDDDIAGIFEHLTPADFATSVSTAIHSTYARDSPNMGEAAFRKFVKVNIDQLRISWAQSEGNVNPLAILASESTTWVFTPRDDESLGQYIDRLHDEAVTLGARWAFISRKTLVGHDTTPPEEGGSVAEISNAERIQKLIETGAMREGVVYFAQRLEGDEREQVFGIMHADGERLGPEVEGSSAIQSVGLFARILG